MAKKRRRLFRRADSRKSRGRRSLKPKLIGDATLETLYAVGSDSARITTDAMAEELRLAAITPPGAFIVNLMPELAFRNIVVFKGPEGEELDESLTKRLQKILVDHDLKKVISEFAGACLTWGRALSFMEKNVPLALSGGHGKKFRVVYPKRSEIQLNEHGWPASYVVNRARLGTTVTWTVTEEEAIFYVYNPTERDSLQGTPLLLTAYLPIKWYINLSRKWTETMATRGLGMVKITIDDSVSEAVFNKIKADYGNVADYNVAFLDDTMDLEVVSSTAPSFDFAATMEQFIQMISTATGIPSMRLIGVQTGAVTGSETDQDNLAQILSGLQDAFKMPFKQHFTLVDPTITPDMFDVEWKFDIQMSERAKLETMSQAVNVVTELEDFIGVGQAFKILNLPVPDDAQTKLDMSLNDWLVEQQSGKVAAAAEKVGGKENEGLSEKEKKEDDEENEDDEEPDGGSDQLS